MQNHLNTIIKVLTLRITREEILSFDKKLFLYGLLGTWIAGMGRYWDNPKVEILQKLGIGSVVYIFLMAALLWFVILPFRVKDWSYFRVLTFVSLTSFPAIIYAIPVEKWTDIETAISLNKNFLLIVALWRVLMLFRFFKVTTRLANAEIITAMLLPICGIIVILTFLNLEKAIFEIMGGLRDTTPNDGAYATLNILTLFSMLLSPFLLGFYLWAVYYYNKYKYINK